MIFISFGVFGGCLLLCIFVLNVISKELFCLYRFLFVYIIKNVQSSWDEIGFFLFGAMQGFYCLG